MKTADSTKKPRRPSSPKRLQTERRLVAAVGAILKKRGVRGIGVNAVAAEAEVDKALIYRYFGGLPELLAAYGESAEFWPSLEELLGSDPSYLQNLTMGGMAAALLSNYAEALRTRPVTLDLLAWECVERTPLTEALEAVRERRSTELFLALGQRGVPITLHLQTAAVLFSAALQYLAIRGRDLAVYAGLSIQEDEGWRQIYHEIRVIFDALANVNSR